MTADLMSRLNFRDAGSAPEADVAASVAAALDADPVPAKKAAKKAAGAARRGRPTRSDTTRKQLRDEIEMYVKMGGLAWSIRDEVCGPALDEHSAKIADALVDLIMRSDWLVEKAQTTSLLADFFQAGMALYPVVKTIVAHHARPHHEDGGAGDAPDWSAYSPYRP